jgi:hypothetical protein
MDRCARDLYPRLLAEGANLNKRRRLSLIAGLPPLVEIGHATQARLTGTIHKLDRLKLGTGLWISDLCDGQSGNGGHERLMRYGAFCGVHKVTPWFEQ